MLKRNIFTQTYTDLLKLIINDLSVQKKVKIPFTHDYEPDNQDAVLKEFLSKYDVNTPNKNPESLILGFLIKGAVQFEPLFIQVFNQFIYSHKDSLFFGLSDSITELMNKPPVTFFSSVFYIFYIVKKYCDFSIPLFTTESENVQAGTKQHQAGRTLIITEQLKEHITVTVRRNSLTDFILRICFKATIWDILFLDWLQSSWFFIDREGILCSVLQSIPRQMQLYFFREPFLFFEGKDELLRESFFNRLAISIVRALFFKKKSSTDKDRLTISEIKTMSSEKKSFIDTLKLYLMRSREKRLFSIKRNASLYFLKTLDLQYQSLYSRQDTKFSYNCQYIIEFCIIFFYRILLKLEKITRQSKALKFIVDNQGNRPLYSYLNSLCQDIMKRSEYLLEYNHVIKRYTEQIKELFPRGRKKLFQKP